jgi:dethiobiotin synthetase
VTRLFVTATGTGVGKTFVTAALAHCAREAGSTLRVLKPLISGFEPGDAGSDSAVLAAAAGLPADAATLERIAPWRYRAPLSPDMAAAREGRTIEVDAVIGFCRTALAGPEECVLIEGVGGVMVPLDDQRTVRDWIAALDIPIILVAGSYLGTLSHTLTALVALADVGIVPRAIVVSESVEAPVPMAETVAALGRFVGTVPIVGLPRLSGEAGWRRAPPDLSALLD